jgi:cation transport protein ChaC
MMDNDNELAEHPLSRDMLESGLVQKLALDRDGENNSVLSEEELVASRRNYIADDYKGPDIWVFGYGSLIWNPLITYEEKQFGHVYGYHKRFCLWTRLGRGSPEDPGLVLALDRGGSVRGVVFRIAAKHAAQEMDILWRREMVNNSYDPKWVNVHTDNGVKTALGFVIRQDSPGFAKRMPDETMAEIIAKATGFLGPCCHYLFETADALNKAGINDPKLKRLVTMVKRCQAKG